MCCAFNVILNIHVIGGAWAGAWRGDGDGDALTSCFGVGAWRDAWLGWEVQAGAWRGLGGSAKRGAWRGLGGSAKRGAGDGDGHSDGNGDGDGDGDVSTYVVQHVSTLHVSSSLPIHDVTIFQLASNLHFHFVCYSILNIRYHVPACRFPQHHLFV